MPSELYAKLGEPLGQWFEGYVELLEEEQHQFVFSRLEGVYGLNTRGCQRAPKLTKKFRSATR